MEREAEKDLPEEITYSERHRIMAPKEPCTLCSLRRKSRGKQGEEQYVIWDYNVIMGAHYLREELGVLRFGVCIKQKKVWSQTPGEEVWRRRATVHDAFMLANQDIYTAYLQDFHFKKGAKRSRLTDPMLYSRD